MDKNAVARQGLERIDKYVQAALTGVLGNEAWNSPQAQQYLRAKKMTLEQIAVAAGMEAIVQLDKFLKGEQGGDSDEAQLSLLEEV